MNTMEIMTYIIEDLGEAAKNLYEDKCDAPFPEGPLTTRQLAECLWMSGNPTSLMKIGQSLFCTGSSTQGTKPVPTISNDHTGSMCE